MTLSVPEPDRACFGASFCVYLQPFYSLIPHYKYLYCMRFSLIKYSGLGIIWNSENLLGCDLIAVVGLVLSAGAPVCERRCRGGGMRWGQRQSAALWITRGMDLLDAKLICILWYPWRSTRETLNMVRHAQSQKFRITEFHLWVISTEILDTTKYVQTLKTH